ncbi:MAG TPA: serine protease [Gemmatimonadales bacterium]|jgi:hypothetical protein|nr:serine protease [Gemmatimonadales bacterium]
MHIDHFFFRLYRVADGVEEFIGSGFPVTEDGGLLTCKHVAEAVKAPGELYVHHNVTGWKIQAREVRTSRNRNLDMAFIPQALGRGIRSYVPLLPPRKALVGVPIHSYGFFAAGGPKVTIEQGFFAGHIVNLLKTEDKPPAWLITLPYPVIEGMSGSAVLTEVNGPKLVGLAFGNQSARILASEVVEYQDKEKTLHEAVYRIVEFGRAYHVSTVIEFLDEVNALGYRVTEDFVPMPGMIPPPGVG